MYIVHRKKDPEKDIAFQFEFKKKPQVFEATLAYDCTEFLNLNNESENKITTESLLKRTLDKEEEENDVNEIKEKKAKNETLASSADTKDDTVVPKKTNIIKDQLVCTICDELMHDCVR